jgi:hypothetical protein
MRRIWFVTAGPGALVVREIGVRSSQKTVYERYAV